MDFDLLFDRLITLTLTIVDNVILERSALCESGVYLEFDLRRGQRWYRAFGQRRVLQWWAEAMAANQRTRSAMVRMLLTWQGRQLAEAFHDWHHFTQTLYQGVHRLRHRVTLRAQQVPQTLSPKP